MEILGIDEIYLKEHNSYETAFEICSQPDKWKLLYEDYLKKEKEIFSFFEKIGLDETFDIIFTGAGSSEYIGNILVPILSTTKKYTFKSVATTDIVTNPEMYLKENKKTLLISFARSGDSPESVATINLANKIVKNIFHLFITCNKEGHLAKIGYDMENVYTFLMPEGTNDKGFAMTSSLSCMLLTALLIFYKPKNVLEMIEKVRNNYISSISEIHELSKLDNERIVILGSGPFKGLSQELALKVMELTAGKCIAKFDSTLGFRHGPKSIINSKTIVFICNNPIEYASKYDIDLYEEIRDDGITKDLYIYKVNGDILEAIFTYLVKGQIYAFFKSQYFNLETNNPFPEGEVNRVVKKFKIYEY